MIKEFKEFIQQGNVMALAVAVIIGAAFGAIVSSLVDNIITPVIGLIMGGVDFSSLSIQFGEATIGYGAFIQAIIDFLIIAFVVFLMVKAVNKVQGPEEEDAPAAPAEDVVLLGEIRDLLQSRS